MSCSGFVPSDIQNFKDDLGQQLKTAIRFIKRYLYMLFRRQVSLEEKRIPVSARRILWINLSAPSLGDALMDTSGRKLLGDRKIDLLTSEKNSMLFFEDAFFFNVYTKVRDVMMENSNDPYDLCILDSFSPRVIGVKARVCPTTRFVGLYGFLNGYEVHRTLFNFSRIEHLLGLTHQSTRPWVVHHGLGSRVKRLPRGHSHRDRVAIGVGGEWGYRTYANWKQVILEIVRGNELVDICLLGSANGRALALEILDDPRLMTVPIENLVGKTSLEQTAAELRQCKVYVGADGGLWHLAVGAGLPTVVVFANKALYNEVGNRVGLETHDHPICMTVHTDKNVNEADPTFVAEKVLTLVYNTRSLN